MLLWFTDLMNVTEEVTIHRPNFYFKEKVSLSGPEELLGPQASLRVTPCPQAPNHTRGEVIRPPSQIESNSYSVIRTRGLDDLSCTRCELTIAARPSRNWILYQAGGEG